MDRKKRGILLISAEVMVLICTLIFVVMVYGNTESISDLSCEEMAVAVLGEELTAPERTIKAADRDFRQEFGMEAADFDGVYYFRPESGLDASELLIVKVRSAESGEVLLEALKNQVDDKSAAFEGYAPDQYALLKASEPIYKEGFIFFAAGNGAAELYDRFYKAVRE